MRIKKLSAGLAVLLLIATIGLQATRVQAATQTFGNTTAGSLTDDGDSNYLNGSRFTTGSTGGTLTSISAYVAAISPSPNNKYQVAIYADTNNKPSTLIAKSATGTLVANSWNTLPVSATITANTKYWLMYNTNGTSTSKNDLKYANGGTGGYTSSGAAFGTMPSPFGGFTGNTLSFSIYGTYTVSAATPPTVSLTAPADGATVSGSAQAVGATASDAVGVAGVQFKLDGANLGPEDTTSPYGVSWNTTTASNGAHSLTAVARNTSGLTTTSSAVNVTVSNVVAPPSVPTGLSGAAISSTQVNLSWNTSTGASSYKLYRNSTQAGAPTGTSYADTGLTAATTYSYTVSAVNAGGESAQSAPITVTTQAVSSGNSFTEDFNFPDGLLGNGWMTANGVPAVNTVNNQGSTSNTMPVADLKGHGMNVSGDWQIDFDTDAPLAIGHGGTTVGLINPADFSGYSVFIGNAVHIQRYNPGGTHDNLTNWGRTGEGSGHLANHVTFTHSAAGYMAVYLDGVLWADITDAQVTPGSYLFISLSTADSPAFNTTIDNLVLQDHIGTNPGLR